MDANVLCRGSIILGSHCGKCQRCIDGMRALLLASYAQLNERCNPEYLRWPFQAQYELWGQLQTRLVTYIRAKRVAKQNQIDEPIPYTFGREYDNGTPAPTEMNRGSGGGTRNVRKVLDD